ncbi:hypothetical protein QR66_17855, partial [Chromobacterium piscinae]
LEAASQGKKGRTGLSEGQSALASLRAQIEEEKALIAQLQANPVSGQVESITSGQKKQLELTQRLSEARDAETRVSLNAQLAKAKELDLLQQETQALQLAIKVRQTYETAQERMDREHRERQNDIARAQLAPQEKARYGQAEDQRYAQANADARSGELQAIGLQTEEEQIRASYQRRQALILQATRLTEDERADYTRRNQEQLNRDLESMQNQYLSTMLGNATQLFEGMAGLAEVCGGRQSAMYKTLFAVSKAASIAQAIVNTEEAATKALTMGPIMGVPAATMVRGLGYASVGVMAATTLAGMAHDGIDDIPREGTWLLQKGERVIDNRTNADLKTYLQRMNRQDGAAGTAAPVTITINNLAPGVEVEAEESRRPDGGRDVVLLVRQVTKQTMREEMRDGGMLYNLARGRG